jgi:hypothetical protein
VFAPIRLVIAAAMLHLHERNILLESLREDVARYLRGGHDQHLHARLLKNLDQLNRQTDLSTLLLATRLPCGLCRLTVGP